MTRALVLACRIALAACAGCHARHEASDPRPSSIATPEPSSVVPRPPLASAAAFDVALTNGGAVLVWAEPMSNGSGIFALELDAKGLARAAPRRIAQAEPAFEVRELTAAATSRELGLLWTESNGARSTARSLHLSLGATERAAPVALATLPEAVPQERGRLALASDDDGRLRMLFPTGPTECIESGVGPCLGFGFRELHTEAPRAEPWLSVPQPCARGAALLGTLRAHFYYALCSWTDAAPVTMAYSIQMEPSYARADRVLAGCVPLGITRVEGDALLLVGDCGPVRKAARLTLDPTPPAELVLADLALACDQGTPIVRANGWVSALDAPRDRIEALLPSSVATEGARAVFTGRAVLVAEAVDGHLVLHARTCSGDEMRGS